MSRVALLRQTTLVAHHMRTVGRFLPARVVLHLGDIDYRPPLPDDLHQDLETPPGQPRYCQRCRRIRRRSARRHGDANSDDDDATDNAIFDACELSEWDGDDFAHSGDGHIYCCCCNSSRAQDDSTDARAAVTIRELLEASPLLRLYAPDVRNSVASTCARLALVVCCDARGDALELLHPDIDIARRWYLESPTLRASCVEICIAIPETLRDECLALRGPVTLELRRVTSHRPWVDSVVGHAASQRPTYLARSVTASAAAPARATTRCAK